jgi:hypothetical protein
MMAQASHITVQLDPRQVKLLERTSREVQRLNTTIMHAGVANPKTIEAFNRCAASINEAIALVLGTKPGQSE